MSPGRRRRPRSSARSSPAPAPRSPWRGRRPGRLNLPTAPAPAGWARGPRVGAAEPLAAAGADVIDVADSPMAKMRMSAWAACRLIPERDIERGLHFPTPGRHLLRLQWDLPGAAALGIRNLFVC